MKNFYTLIFLLVSVNIAISEPIQVKGKLQDNGLYSLGKAYQIDPNSKYIKNKIYVKFKDNADYTLLLNSFVKRNNSPEVSFPFQELKNHEPSSLPSPIGRRSPLPQWGRVRVWENQQTNTQEGRNAEEFPSLEGQGVGKNTQRYADDERKHKEHTPDPSQEGRKNSPSSQGGAGGCSPNLLQNIALITFKQNSDIPALCAELNKYEEVEYAVPQYIHEFRFIPNDTEYSKQYYLQLINMEQAWEISKGSSDVIISIVDSGTDILHDDLNANIWVNPNEIPGNNIDDDGNGYIDDVSGWDFIGDLTQVEVNQSLWKEDNNVIPNHASNMHGTHVAGIAAAVTNNSIGIASPAFNCKILPVKVATDNLDPNSNGTSATLRGYEGILYAAQMGADIINVSWGAYSYSPLEEDIIKQAQAYGALIVAAVGNDSKKLVIGSNDYPAMYPGVIAVGATNTNGGQANYSNYGIPVDVFAPGNSILSTLPNNNYGNLAGASMASPLVASVAALVKSANPDFDNATITQQIHSSSKNISGAESRSQYFYGVLNAENALKYNNSNYPELEVPGISVSNISTTYKYGFINNYDDNIFKISFKNYLADAKNIQIKISNYDNALEESKIYSLNELKNNAEFTFDYEFKLRLDFPWYYEKLELRIEIIADNYQNYELIELTLLMPTYNKFRVSQEFIDFNIGWFDSHSPNYDEFYAVGYDYNQDQPVMLSYQKRYTDFRTIAPFEATSIFVDENDIAYLTTKSGMLLKTANRGESFTVIYDVLNSPDDLYILNDEILFTDLDSEDNSYLYKGNSQSFDLLKEINNGKPIIDYYKSNIVTISQKYNFQFELSKDLGENWQSFDFISAYDGIKILDTEFINDSIFAICFDAPPFYNTGKLELFNLNRGIIISTYDLPSAHLTKLYTPDDSEDLLLIYKNLEVQKFRNGEFQQILSFNHHEIFTADGVSECGSTQIWQMGKDLAYLEMDYLPNDIEKQINVLGKKIITFDTTDVGNEDTDFVMLENAGNVRAIIESIEIEGDDAFYISSDKPLSVPSCDYASFFVSFKPETYGDFTADLVIKTNSEPAELFIKLIGTGYDHTSVKDLISDDEFLIYPNPASDFIFVNYDGLSIDSKVAIYNSLGQEILTYNLLAQNQKIDISSLQSGMYVIKITKSGKNNFYKFIKI